MGGAQKRTLVFVPLVMYTDDGRVIIGKAEVEQRSKIDEVIGELVEGDAGFEIHITAQVDERYKNLFSTPVGESSIAPSFAVEPYAWNMLVSVSDRDAGVDWQARYDALTGDSVGDFEITEFRYPTVQGPSDRSGGTESDDSSV